MGSAGQPMGHLDLRFLMFLEHLLMWTYVFKGFCALDCQWAIWTYVFRCLGAPVHLELRFPMLLGPGRFRSTPVQRKRPGRVKFHPTFVVFGRVFGPRAGTVQEGYRHLYS